MENGLARVGVGSGCIRCIIFEWSLRCRSVLFKLQAGDGKERTEISLLEGKDVNRGCVDIIVL